MNRSYHALSAILLLSFFLIIKSGMAQPGIVANDTATHPYYLEMMQDPDVNFHATQSAFYKFWAHRTDYKGNGWKVFKRWEYINESRVLADGNLQAPGYVKAQYDDYMSKSDGPNAASGNWTFTAPQSYPANNTTQPTGMGRINAIAFHPTDASTIYIGSPSGGLWKTTSGGAAWTNLFTNMPTLGVSSILVHPIDPNIIYIGSGDRDASDAEPMGVFKSTDGGTTWAQKSNSMGNATVGAMIMHPSNANIILAATSNGIYKTTDGGTSWNLKATGNFKDIKFNAGDPSIVYAVKVITPSEFYRSSSTGDSWTKITAGIPATGIGSRMVIGVSPANPSIVYLVQIKSADKNFAGLLRSTDGGLTFNTQSVAPNIFDYNCDGSGTASQATYDLCTTVDQGNANIVYVGSINNWKSTDGGVTWSIVSHWIGSNMQPGNPTANCAASIHADQHVYEWSPLNGRLYVGHDGGINYSADGGTTWPEITGALPITQVYKIGQSATISNLVLMGMQDNGSAASNGGTFTTTRGGDGTECIVDYSSASYCYNTYVQGDISRSSTGSTGSYSNIGSTGTNGIGADETGAWVTPYFLHRTNASTMFAGYENVWRTTNLKASPASAVSWSAISAGETTTCRVLEQSPANVDLVYVVRSGAMKRSDNVNAAAGLVAWTACALPGGTTPTDVKAHPSDANIVYATAGYKVYKSIDKGATWTDLSGNLPALFINCLVLDKNANEGIYIGNQTSVWYKDASMTNWILFNTGLPPVDIRELEIYYDAGAPANNRIKAATYGRGIWESDLAMVNVIDPSAFTANAASASQINLAWSKNASGNDVLVAWSSTGVFGTPADGVAYSAGNTLPSGGGTILYQGALTSFSHTSLSAATTCYYKIWSVDGSNQYSAGLPPINETTDCSAISTLPYSENFDNPACWRTKDNTGQGNWQFGTTSNVNYTPALSSPYAYFSSEYGVAHNYSADLISPTFDLSSYSCIQLRFNHLFDRSGSYPSTGKVYYSINNGTNWVEIASYSSVDSPNPEAVTLLVGAVAGQSQVKFKWNYSCSPTGAYLWAVDDVTVSVYPGGVWTGSTNTDWHTSSNWCTNAVPTATTDVIIPTGTANMPYISSITVAHCRDIILQTGATLKMAANTELDVTGNWTNNGNYDYTNSSNSALVKFNGSALQTYSGATILTLRKLTVDNTSGLTLATELRADNIALTNGIVTTNGSARLNLFGGTLTRTNGYVNGTLQKYMFTNPGSVKNITYETGDAANYTPVSFSFPSGSITVAGGFSLKTITADHPNIATSSLNLNKSVNRYWTFPLIGITFSTCSAVFNFVPGDLDAGASTANLEAGRYASPLWTYPTVGTKTSTSAQITGLSSATLGDIQLAESKNKASIVSGGNWSSSSTWNPSGVPDAGNNLTITAPGTVVVDVSNAACNDLAIQSGATLEISPMQALTVSGTLINSAGTAGLVVKSDPSGTGSLIHATSNVDGTVERYMNNADWTNGSDGWHFLSSPMLTQPISPAFTTDPYDFYCWYEPANLWVNFKNTTTPPTWNTANGSTNFNLGKGYLAEYDNEGVKLFTGKLNVSDVAVTNLAITAGGNNRSWHLIGNPFGCALSWDASTAWGLTNIAGVAKIWNEANQSYSDLSSSPSGVIPATNGFMVQVNSGTGSLVLPAAKRVHSAVPFYKNTVAELMLKVVGVLDGNAQESRLIVNPDATEGFDIMYDGEFLTGYAPEFYAKVNGQKLSTNSIPGLSLSTEILYRFVKTAGKDFRIDVSGIETFPGRPLLHDLKTGTVTDLSLYPVYTFTAAGSDNPDRFLLKFGNVGTGSHEKPALRVYYNQPGLFLLNTEGEVKVEVFSLTGSNIYRTTTTSNQVQISLPSGIYFARVTSKNQVGTVKFFVR